MKNTSLAVSLVGFLMVVGCGESSTEMAQHQLGLVNTVKFEGRVINLASDWGEARSCLVWHQAGVVECFRTDEELNRRAADAEHQMITTRRESAQEPDSGQEPEEGDTSFTATCPARGCSGSCSSSLNLYENSNFNRDKSGRHLVFRDRRCWQDLGCYSFNDKASSYIVGACGAHLAKDIGGGGGWYPGNTSVGARVGGMGSWNDEVSSIKLN